jgi:predicted PurR-regulated permease PerM
MSSEMEQTGKLPPPWDRIFSLGTRTFVWGLLVAILYILRPFLLLIFLTFVFAYIQAHGVDGLQHRIRNRPARVILVGLVFLGTIVATVLTLTPQIEMQALTLVKNYKSYITNADREINAKLKEYPQVWDYLVQRESLGAADNGAAAHKGAEPQQKPQETPEKPKDERQPTLIRDLVDSLLGLSGETPSHNPAESLKRVFDVGSSVLGYISSFLLAVLFSFMIVLDLPFLKRGIAGLAATKVGFIYDEVSGTIATFAKVLGRALEAQLFIAIANTILTALGIWILGIGNIPVLSAIVFVFSFIPVAGVFISSAPICLLALQDPTGGFGLMLASIGMVLVVHGIETYILNPRIYGHHMRMNPVLVLIVLTVSGKLFGVWGFLLGIPLVNYVFRHAIRYQQPKDAA